MEVNIFQYVSKTEYEKICSQLKNNETKTVYTDDYIEIEVKKVSRKIYTFINTFGDKKLNEALNNIYSLAS